MTASIFDVRRASDRFATQAGWLDSHHSFSFGGHYDPDNTHFGCLLVSNDDIVRAGTGFDTHPHRDMEIVTWVLSGSLVHQDSEGHTGVIYPGLAQRMSAGTGIRHSEKNDSWTITGDPVHAQDVHFIQMWVVPDESGIRPGYEQLDVNESLDRGGLTVVASGLAQHSDESAIRISNRYAGLHAGRLVAAQQVSLPDAPFVHLGVASGSVTLEGSTPIDLVAGDSVRLTAADGPRLTAGLQGAEVLVWEMHAALG